MDAYIVVMEYSAADLAERVCNLMAEGYTPCGGIAVLGDPEPDGDYFRYFQAMVRA